jgi:hypothetical protein
MRVEGGSDVAKEAVCWVFERVEENFCPALIHHPDPQDVFERTGETEDSPHDIEVFRHKRRVGLDTSRHDSQVLAPYSYSYSEPMHLDLSHTIRPILFLVLV